MKEKAKLIEVLFLFRNYPATFVAKPQSERLWPLLPSTSTMRSFGVPMVLESVITSSFLSPESCSASRRSSERGWDVPCYEQNQTARAHWYLIPFRRAIWVPSRLCEFPCRKLHRNPKKCQGTRTPWVSPQVPCNTATIGSDVQTQ